MAFHLQPRHNSYKWFLVSTFDLAFFFLLLKFCCKILIEFDIWVNNWKILQAHLLDGWENMDFCQTLNAQNKLFSLYSAFYLFYFIFPSAYHQFKICLV